MVQAMKRYGGAMERAGGEFSSQRGWVRFREHPAHEKP
jgi:hypothetical protein